MKRTNKILSRPVRISIFFRKFSYVQTNTEMGREARRGVSRSYLRDTFFKRDDPVFIKSGKDLLDILNVSSLVPQY